jgi:hypothetical protein
MLPKGVLVKEEREREFYVGGCKKSFYEIKDGEV